MVRITDEHGNIYKYDGYIDYDKDGIIVIYKTGKTIAVFNTAKIIVAEHYEKTT